MTENSFNWHFSSFFTITLLGPPTTNVEEYQSNSFDSEKEVFEEADETPMPPRSPKKILFADETHRQPSVEVSGPEPSDEAQEATESKFENFEYLGIDLTKENFAMHCEKNVLTAKELEDTILLTRGLQSYI